MPESTLDDSESHELDPVFVSSLREAKAILVVFALWAVYTLGVAYTFGYQARPSLADAIASEPNFPLVAGDAIPTVFGIPAWVFWAIVIPWLAANLITAWFCFSYLSNDDLEEDAIGSEPIGSDPSDAATSTPLEDLS